MWTMIILSKLDQNPSALRTDPSNPDRLGNFSECSRMYGRVSVDDLPLCHCVEALPNPINRHY